MYLEDDSPKKIQYENSLLNSCFQLIVYLEEDSEEKIHSMESSHSLKNVVGYSAEMPFLRFPHDDSKENIDSMESSQQIQ